MSTPRSPSDISRKEIERSFMWPFVYWPLIWILLIHVGTRVAWLLGFS